VARWVAFNILSLLYVCNAVIYTRDVYHMANNEIKSKRNEHV